MAISTSSVLASSLLAQHCPDFNNCELYKKIAYAAISTLPLEKQPKARVRTIMQFMMVIVYSWLRGYSFEMAEKKLDLWVKAQVPGLVQPYDNHRFARAVPHQTVINKWLSKLSVADVEKMAKTVFKQGLDQMLLKKHRFGKIVVEFDFTLLGYWGKRRDSMIIGLTLVKGAKHIRHYHAAYIHGAGVSQYVAMHHAQKGESLVSFITETLDKLKVAGFKIQWVLADRQYYAQDVLDAIKAQGVKIITPTKEYKQLKRAKIAYLNGTKGRVQQFFLGKQAKKGQVAPPPTACWVVLLATRNYHLGRIRAQYQRGQITADQASDCIFGLITNCPPRFFGRHFAAKLQKYYKMRWQIETAFRVTDGHTSILRSNYDGTRLFCELGPYFLYNEWQYAQISDSRKKRLTYQTFRDEVVDKINQQVNL